MHQHVSNYADAPREGIRRILEMETGIPHPRTEKVDTSRIEYIRMGTTVATNALLERKGEKIALITTKGFEDLQIIGNQTRPKIFDLEIKRPDILFDYVAALDERVILLGSDSSLEKDAVLGLSGEKVVIENRLDDDEVIKILQEIKSRGIKSIAVVLMHSYTFSDHEKRVKKLAESMGFDQISLSSEVMPMVSLVHLYRCLIEQLLVIICAKINVI